MHHTHLPISESNGAEDAQLKLHQLSIVGAVLLTVCSMTKVLQLQMRIRAVGNASIV